MGKKRKPATNKPDTMATRYIDQDLPLEGLPERTPEISIDNSGLFHLKKEPQWFREPKVDGWYAFRFSESNSLEVIRVVKCRILGRIDQPYNSGFSIEHEAMGCIHRDQRQKEFWFAGPIDLDTALSYALDRQADSPDCQTP